MRLSSYSWKKALSCHDSSNLTQLVCFDGVDLHVKDLYLYLDLQIVVGGRNKYLINGKLAQPSQVQNLFHSVQLNVNNPHFLIMQ